MLLQALCRLLRFCIFFLSPPLPRACIFGNMMPSAQDESSKARHSHPSRLCALPPNRRSEQPRRLPALSPSATQAPPWASGPGSHGRGSSRLLLPHCRSRLQDMVNIYYFQRQIFYRENTFQVRCFHLGKVMGLFWGRASACGGSSGPRLLLWGSCFPCALGGSRTGPARAAGPPRRAALN